MSEYKYVNHYCYHSKIKELLSLSDDEWLKKMIDNFHNVYPSDPSYGQILAWKVMFGPLVQQLIALPQAYKELDIIFEYVLPKQYMIPDNPGFATHIGERADIIILSSETVLILEFKGKHKNPVWSQRQARKYRNRIQHFHDESYGMNKKDVMVTLGDDSFEKGIYKMFVCGMDNLNDTIVELLEKDPSPHSDPKAWINSGYSIHKSRERQLARRNKR